MRQITFIGLAVLVAGCSAASSTARGVTPRLTGLPVAPGCAVTDKLIPTCGAWWGIAPEVFTGRRPGRAVAEAERRMDRKADIVHVYHRGAELFPTAEERRVADAGRLLLINWKPSTEHTWDQIAKGAADDRIDALATHIAQTFPRRFFLTIHHEPEDDVRDPAQAAAYAAMFRHVVARLRADGARNVVTVMTYMGAPNWAARPWFDRLYPGDDVVDWVAFDPYADARVNDFAGLVDKTRPDHPSWPGFYRWMRSHFPGKPIMVAEWGVFERHGNPGFKPAFYASVQRQIANYPQIKALVYFDSPFAPRGDTRFDTTRAAAHAFRDLARQPYFSQASIPAS
ncbi:hypothetical protein J5X84_32200 [Streptosporangiaceae bacterium NEAU-GS5]|nr:hypothetical protein [Streptosporangiaceae bacterium NEAU-GS5]